MLSLSLPLDYPRIKIVHSFDELVSTRFGDGINALCWQRQVEGDYDEIAAKFGVGEGRLALDEAMLRSLELSPAGQVARETLLADRQFLADHGLSPVLDCIHGYPRDEDGGPVVTDVYSFHADSAPVEADTYLCSYNQTSSEGLRNDQAIRRADVPETKVRLLELYQQEAEEAGLEFDPQDEGASSDPGYLEFLRDCCYDLHYAPAAGAAPFSFGIGNLWRIAIEYPDSPVPPCIHRAPVIPAGAPPRLLLIS